MHRSRRVVFAAGIAALVVGVGACGGGSSSGRGSARVTTSDPVRLIASSADAANAAKSARMSLSMDMSVKGQSASVAADGAFDFTARTGDMTMDLSALGVPGGRIEVRVVRNVLYMDMTSLLATAGPAAAEELGGKDWFELDLSTVTGQSGSSFGALGSSDPTSTLDALRGVSNDVKVLGTEKVRGVDTTHYAMTLDLTKAVDQLPPSSRDAAAKGLQELGTGSVPAEVWIDGNGLPRRYVMRFDGVQASGTSLGALTMELYDYGTPVDVQPPPDSDTVDMMSILGSFGALGAGAGTGSA